MPKEKDITDDDNGNDKDNEVIIAGRDFSIYNQTILDKLQKYDQIVITFLRTYLGRAEYIIRQWEALGVIPESYERHGKLMYEESTEEILEKKTNKYFKASVCRVVLSKQPNQFKFTKA